MKYRSLTGKSVRLPSGKTVSDGQPLPDDHGIKAKDLKVLIAMGRLRAHPDAQKLANGNR